MYAMDEISSNASGSNVSAESRDNVRCRRAPFVRYTSGELEDLKAMILSARQWLKPTHRKHRRQVWIKIAEQMQESGWPKRPWWNLRKKGEQMVFDHSLSDLTEFFPTKPLQSNRLDVSTLATPIVTPEATVCACSIYNQTTEIPLPAFSPPKISQKRTHLPPLIPSSEASATTVISRMNSAHSSTVSFASCQSDNCKRSKIMHEYSQLISEAVRNTNDYARGYTDMDKRISVDSSPVSTPTLSMLPSGCETNNQYTSESLPSEPIDLSISGDEDERSHTSKDNSEVCSRSSTVSTLPALGLDEPQVNVLASESSTSSSSSSSSSKPDLDQAMCEKEHAERIQIYRLKRDILEMKKVYWVQKMKTMFGDT
ncbi:unnamed protein product [Calicophoron daubneyi]|uniref:MADF domain-containing protein n=1 Tax=Calicophoron daubneyi TaxID=300641 RepID=A0AAV2TQW0_CALDB